MLVVTCADELNTVKPRATPRTPAAPVHSENLLTKALAELHGQREALVRALADADAAIAALQRLTGAEGAALPAIAPTDPPAAPAPRQRPRAVRSYAVDLTPDVIDSLEGDQKLAARALAGAGDAGLLSADIARLTGIKRQSISTPLNILRLAGHIRQEPAAPRKSDTNSVD